MGSEMCIRDRRDAISNHTYLFQPDFENPFTLDIDASQVAAGAVLYQTPGCPVSFVKKSFDATSIRF